jgi:hypothetical protein
MTSAAERAVSLDEMVFMGVSLKLRACHRSSRA